MDCGSKSETRITNENIKPLLKAIEQQTGLPISTDGIFRWIVFLPSKTNQNVPVANRYFGVFENGNMKLRGIELRRRDTPLWIAEIQQNLLQEIAALQTLDDFSKLQPKIIQYLKHEIQKLRNKQIPLEKLLVSQKVSRELESYHSPSAAARAAAPNCCKWKNNSPRSNDQVPLYADNTPRSGLGYPRKFISGKHPRPANVCQIAFARRFNDFKSVWHG